MKVSTKQYFTQILIVQNSKKVWQIFNMFEQILEVIKIYLNNFKCIFSYNFLAIGLLKPHFDHMEKQEEQNISNRFLG